MPVSQPVQSARLVLYTPDQVGASQVQVVPNAPVYSRIGVHPPITQQLQPTWLTAFTFVYVTIFSTIAAFVFWNRGVELIGANRAGIFLHLIPIYSALLTGAVLGEPLMGYHVVGFALILAGVWLAARGAKSAPPAEV